MNQDDGLNGYFLATLSILGMICSMVYIVLFFRISKLHKSPGDIYLGMSFAEFFFALHQLSNAVYKILHGLKKPDSRTMYCNINMIIFSMAVVLIYAYSIQLYLHMVIRLIYTLKAKKIKKWQGHLISLVVASLLSISMYLQDGFCGLGYTNQTAITYMLFLISFYMVGVSSKMYINREIAQNEQFEGKSFSQYLSILFGVQASIATVYQISTLLLYVFIQAEVKDIPNILIALGMISQISVCLVPIIFPIVRYFDPFLKKRCRDYFIGKQPQEKVISMVERINTQELQEQQMIKSISYDGPVLKIHLLDKQHYSFDERRHKTNTVDEGQRRKLTVKTAKKSEEAQEVPFIHQLTSQLRSQIMRRILLLILQQQNQSDFCKKIVRQGKNTHFDESHVYSASARCLTQELDNLQVFNMIAHAPHVFNILIQSDTEKIDFVQGLDVSLNEDQIAQCAQTSGGKSGEFFFFNHNNKLLLKTINGPELKVLKGILENYFWHLTNNPETTIAKILGIYTFEGFEVGSLSLIVMKNIGKISSEAFMRIYDLKGSSYDRQVIKIQSCSSLHEQPEKVNQVLKDMDFMNLENTININPLIGEQLYHQIEEDSLFLRQQGLMDYSLCVIKVNWYAYLTSKHKSYDEQLDSELDQELIQAITKARVSKLQHCYESLVEEGVYYHIGIIDYLQKYNAQKIIEKYAKKFMKMNSNLDTSSQDPITYRQRFLNFIKNIL